MQKLSYDWRVLTRIQIPYQASLLGSSALHSLLSKILRFCDPAILRFCDSAILRFCDSAIKQFVKAELGNNIAVYDYWLFHCLKTDFLNLLPNKCLAIIIFQVFFYICKFRNPNTKKHVKKMSSTNKLLLSSLWELFVHAVLPVWIVCFSDLLFLIFSWFQR